MHEKNFNDIKIPKNLKETINLSIKKGYRERKNAKRKKNYKILVASLTLAVGCGLITLNNESVLAAINELKISLSNLFSEDSSANNYINIYDKKITKNKITAKLNEVLFDEPYIKISNSFTLPKKLMENIDFSENSKNNIMWNVSVAIDGKDILTTISSTKGSIKDNTINYIIMLSVYDLKDQHKVNDIYDLEDVMEIIKENNEVELTITFHNFRIVKDMNDIEDLNKQTNNNFKFNIRVPLKNLANESKLFDINKKVEIHSNKFINITKISNSPSSIRLFYDMDISLLYSKKDIFVGFNIYDENDNLLEQKSIVGSGYEIGDKSVGYDCEYGKLKDINKITIIPLYSPESNSDKNNYYEKKEKAIEINLN